MLKDAQLFSRTEWLHGQGRFVAPLQYGLQTRHQASPFDVWRDSACTMGPSAYVHRCRLQANLRLVPLINVPSGPWVLVIGCHRSGTSAVTGALVALGLQGVSPRDRIDNVASNPEHWESTSASLYAEDILVGLGGAWDAPPAAKDEPLFPVAIPSRPDAAEVMNAAYPEPGPLVWKDPRTCLLLPYWRSVLPGPLAAVFVWRDPLAVSRSLHTRDGIALADGLALWERYNRSAAAGLQGVDTYLLNYADIVADPPAVLGGLVTWLRGLGQFGPFVDPWDLDTAIASVDPKLHHESAEDGTPELPDDHQAMVDWLDANGGAHNPLDNMPPAASSPWPEAVLADRRQIVQFRREVDAARGVLTSTSWRITAPLRTTRRWMRGVGLRRRR